MAQYLPILYSLAGVLLAALIITLFTERKPTKRDRVKEDWEADKNF